MKKRAFTFALSLLLVFVLFACDTAAPTDESSEDASSCAESVCSTVEEPVFKVVFFRGETFSEEAAANALRSNYYRAEAFADLESEYSQYNSYIHYESLTENEKLLYRIYEYALYNSYRFVLFDASLLEGSEQTAGSILRILSADSPLLEQNLWFALDEFMLPAGEESEGDAEFNGILLACDNFTFKLFGKKKDAIAIAEKIIEEMPEGLSPMESAKHFYKILGRNTTYDIGEDGIQNYLYDAISGQSTHCDGFANAYSLLCNMAGVPCYEKICNSSDEGHTWNAIYFNHSWYNVDVSAIANFKDGDGRETPFWYGFGFQERWTAGKHIFQELAPVCYGSLRTQD